MAKGSGSSRSARTNTNSQPAQSPSVEMNVAYTNVSKSQDSLDLAKSIQQGIVKAAGSTIKGWTVPDVFGLYDEKGGSFNFTIEKDHSSQNIDTTAIEKAINNSFSYSGKNVYIQYYTETDRHSYGNRTKIYFDIVFNKDQRSFDNRKREAINRVSSHTELKKR